MIYLIIIFIISVFVSFQASIANKCHFEKVVGESRDFSITKNGNIVEKTKIGKFKRICGSL